MMHYDYKRLEFIRPYTATRLLLLVATLFAPVSGIRDACLRRNQGPSAATKKIMVERIERDYTGGCIGAD